MVIKCSMRACSMIREHCRVPGIVWAPEDRSQVYEWVFRKRNLSRSENIPRLQFCSKISDANFWQIKQRQDRFRWWSTVLVVLIYCWSQPDEDKPDRTALEKLLRQLNSSPTRPMPPFLPPLLQKPDSFSSFSPLLSFYQVLSRLLPTRCSDYNWLFFFCFPRLYENQAANGGQLNLHSWFLSFNTLFIRIVNEFCLFYLQDTCRRRLFPNVK